jgi:hypothetical protein
MILGKEHGIWLISWNIKLLRKVFSLTTVTTGPGNIKTARDELRSALQKWDLIIAGGNHY